MYDWSGNSLIIQTGSGIHVQEDLNGGKTADITEGPTIINPNGKKQWYEHGFPVNMYNIAFLKVQEG